MITETKVVEIRSFICPECSAKAIDFIHVLKDETTVDCQGCGQVFRWRHKNQKLTSYDHKKIFLSNHYKLIEE